ncbi:MAG: molybdopterin-dependent oxidoreductase [Anaerolineales bacterium]|jgi:DMSO/TMAO reductase YedYZ molybdopterin-dependent catalytic subunit
MSRRLTLVGLIAGVGMGIPLLAVMALGQEAAGLPFAPFDLFGLLTRILPGSLVVGGVELMVSTLQALRLGSTAALGKFIESGSAVVMALVGLALVGALLGYLWPNLQHRLAARRFLPGVVVWVILIPVGIWAAWSALGFAWMLILTLAWSVVTGWILTPWQTVEMVPVDRDRRAFLGRAAAFALLTTIAGLGLGRLLRRTTPQETLVPIPAGSTPVPAQPGSFAPVLGTRAEVTPISDFYRVDIDLAPSSLNASQWALEIGGQVDKPLTLSYADFTAIPSEDFYATLECISNTVGGDLISTTRFTGVKLADLLARASLRPEVTEIRFECVDGYSESLPLDSALDPETRLCYAMGGATLTPEHGYPARLYTPNRHGMKNPKWIQKIEAVSEPYAGYWEQRGWSKDAFVHTTSVMDATLSETGAIEVGGIAFAGARGIQKVEVQVDGGDWVPAELKPPLSQLAWVIWRAQVPASRGSHRLTVRAVDGSGALQFAGNVEPFSSGATGYDQRNAQAD